MMFTELKDLLNQHRVLVKAMLSQSGTLFRGQDTIIKVLDGINARANDFVDGLIVLGDTGSMRGSYALFRPILELYITAEFLVTSPNSEQLAVDFLQAGFLNDWIEFEKRKRTIDDWGGNSKELLEHLNQVVPGLEKENLDEVNRKAKQFEFRKMTESIVTRKKGNNLNVDSLTPLWLLEHARASSVLHGGAFSDKLMEMAPEGEQDRILKIGVLASMRIAELTVLLRPKLNDTSAMIRNFERIRKGVTDLD
jgi:hypothetical protein